MSDYENMIESGRSQFCIPLGLDLNHPDLKTAPLMRVQVYLTVEQATAMRDQITESIKKVNGCQNE